MGEEYKHTDLHKKDRSNGANAKREALASLNRPLQPDDMTHLRTLRFQSTEYVVVLIADGCCLDVAWTDPNSQAHFGLLIWVHCCHLQGKKEAFLSGLDDPVCFSRFVHDVRL